MVRKERCIEHVKIETLFFSLTFPYMEDNLHFCTGNKRKERRILTKEKVNWYCFDQYTCVDGWNLPK